MPVLRIRSMCAYGLLASLVLLGPALPATADADLTHDQWALEAIAVHGAWEHAQGSGTTVAILDTGVDDTHPDLGYTGQEDDSESSVVTIGDDATDGAGEASEVSSGTQLAGLIAARGHGQEFSGGVLGVAPEAEILALRVTEEGQSPEGEAVAAALRQAARDGAQVALLPPAPQDVSADVEHAITYARNNGVVPVAPAGPTAYEGVLGVAAVGSDSALLDPPSQATTLVAPGEGLTTIDVGGGYTEISGAGAAAALVAGTVALVRSAYPRLHPADVSEALAEGARLPETVGEGEGYGAGVLNAEQTLAAADRLAQEAPPIDDNLAAAPEEEEGVSPWVPATLAGLVALLVLLGLLLLRRRWADPYGLRGQKVSSSPPSGRRSATRRGRRARDRGARHS